MRHLMRLSVGLLAGVALFLAGCGHASSPPPKAHANLGSALHLSAGPVVAVGGGEFKVVLTGIGQQVGKSYSLTATGATFHRLGMALGAPEGSSWQIQYTEEGTSGRTRFTMLGPVPSAAPPTSNTVVVTW